MITTLTRHRKLRTGRSVWQAKRKPAVPHAPLAESIEADVLVVGAGISGAMIADALAGAGLSVVVADRRGPIDGSTAASTALLQYEIDVPLTTLARKIGVRDAVRAWRRSRLALDGLSARLRDGGIAGATLTDSLYLAGDVLDADRLREEGEARRAAGFETLFLDAAALKERFGIERAAALLSYDNLAADPRIMTARFLNAAIAAGAKVYAPTEIVEIDARPRKVTARTSEGHRIAARHCVLATGYELWGEVPAKGHRIVSTWAIATRPQRRRLWPEGVFIWEASDPYLYMRVTSDGRAICGGEDEEIADAATRDALLPDKTLAISAKLGQLMPDLDTEADFAWTAAFGASDDGLPTIAEVPGMSRCWAVMGYGGNGITYSRIAAEAIRTALTQKGRFGEDPDLDLYAFR